MMHIMLHCVVLCFVFFVMCIALCAVLLHSLWEMEGGESGDEQREGEGKGQVGREEKRRADTHAPHSLRLVETRRADTHAPCYLCAPLSFFLFLSLCVALLLLFQGTKLGIKNGGKSADQVGGGREWR